MWPLITIDSQIYEGKLDSNELYIKICNSAKEPS